MFYNTHLKFIFLLLLTLPFYSIAQNDPQNQTAQLGLNDISILVPLPKNVSEFNLLISPKMNELIPLDMFQRFPSLDGDLTSLTMYTDHLRAVGIRFDPCFIGGFPPLQCRFQIRIVWQPVMYNAEIKGYTTLDVAMHSFYDFNFQQWVKIKNELSEIAKISKINTTLPLQIHPYLKQNGLNSNYWKKLSALILKNASSTTLTQVTAMTLRAQQFWTFSGFEKKSNQWESIAIPRLGENDHDKVTLQLFNLTRLSMENPKEFFGFISDLKGIDSERWNEFVNSSLDFKKTYTEDEVRYVISRGYEFENPQWHNPGTVDCVSCHISQSVRMWGKNNFPNWNPLLFMGFEYQNKKSNLTNVSPAQDNVNRLRGFGYFETDPAISQRVINESAEILQKF